MTINARTLWAALLAVFVAAAAIVTIQAQAQERPQRRDGRMERGIHRMGPARGMGPAAGLRGLDLSDEQREQIRAIVQEARGSRQAERTDTARLHRELRAAVFADQPDPAKIDALKASIVQAHAAALDARVALDLKIAEVLTPEQRAKAAALRNPGNRARR